MLLLLGMTPDDAHTSHNHGFELPNAPQIVVRSDARPWRAVAGVAVCLGLAGVVTGLIVARRQSASDAHLTSDALQREELRDGWKALGAAAVIEARANGEQAPLVANSANAAPASPNVVIVNVPAQSATAAPPNVTNINLPNGPYTGSNNATTDTSNPNPGMVPIQTSPPVTYSPVQGYVPPQVAYPAPPTNYVPGNAPNNVGNGSIPGSTPNPALPNNGLVGSSPTPGSLNGPANGGATPSAPVAPAPASPGTPTLPSGFSAP